MPRPRKDAQLDSQLLAIAQKMTAEVAALVRQEIANQMTRIIGTVNGSAIGANGSARRGRGNGASAQLVSTVLDTIKRSPGLRTEQIYAKLPGHAAPRVKAALAKLRAGKKVRTSGNRRAMTYRSA